MGMYKHPPASSLEPCPSQQCSTHQWWRQGGVTLEETLRAVNDLYNEGLFQRFGVSNFPAYGVSYGGGCGCGCSCCCGGCCCGHRCHCQLLMLRLAGAARCEPAVCRLCWPPSCCGAAAGKQHGPRWCFEHVISTGAPRRHCVDTTAVLNRAHVMAQVMQTYYKAKELGYVLPTVRRHPPAHHRYLAGRALG